jgi:hypothetical protein
MPNPSAQYAAFTNGVERPLNLVVDSAGNLTGSTIGVNSDPIVGSYDDTTGEITFSELIKEPGGLLLGGPFAPSYLGYLAIQQPDLQLTFAGTYTELVLVNVGPGLYRFERVNHGWFAMQVLFTTAPASR